MPVTILIIEDIKIHFDEIETYVDTACQALHLIKNESGSHGYVVQRILGERNIEEALTQYAARGMPILLIFDIHMEHDGSAYDLDGVISSIWDAPPNTWLGSVHIIINSAIQARVEKHPRGRRHAIKIPKFGNGTSKPWVDLNNAIRESVRALKEQAGAAQ